ncbi:ribonuclease H-like domain-containing protein [Tanacetum coccineum]
MITRSKDRITRPIQRLNLHVSTPAAIPKSYIQAIQNPNWKNAMLDEFNALIKNDTWVLVPRPTNANIVRSMWLFKHKFNADGTLSRYKARLVANGSSQQQGIDCDETFSPVVKAATIRTVLSLAVSKQWPIHQLDVKMPFFMVPSVKLTPADSEKKLGPEGTPVSDPTLYRSLAGALQYLTFTRPDLSYVVQQLCLYMHDPREPHLNALKRVLRYVCGTIDLGLELYQSFTSQLITYSDADWAGSSVEVEYRGVANVVAETAWIRNLLRELHVPLYTATLVYCDNVSAIYMSANPVQHQRTKHIEIDIHFVRDKVAAGHVRVLHVPSRF